MHGREVPEEVSYYPAWLYGRSLQLRDVRVLRDRQCAWVHCGNRANLVKLTCMCAVHLSSALGTRMLSYTMPWLDSLRAGTRMMAAMTLHMLPQTCILVLKLCITYRLFVCLLMCVLQNWAS